MDGFSYLLACLLDLLENIFVGDVRRDDDFLLLEGHIVGGNTCIAEVWV